MIFCRIYGLVLERSDASFQQCIMPHDTTAENCNTRSNTAETAEISSHWKSAEIADFPSRWKFGPYGQKNGGGIVVIPPPRALRRAYAVSCRETKNPNPLPTANRFGFLDFGTGSGSRTHTVAHRNLNPARLPIPPYPHIQLSVQRAAAAEPAGWRYVPSLASDGKKVNCASERERV